MSTPDRDRIAAADVPFDIGGAVTVALGTAVLQLEMHVAEVSRDPAFDVLLDEIRALVGAGGKRVRPAFCYWGYRAAGGDDPAGIVPVGAAIELVHVCALVHDDIMDVSALRRGRPTSHRMMSELHARETWHGDKAHFGTSAALLLGDLALIVADEVLGGAPFPAPAWRAAFGDFTQMRVEVTLGQYLDLVEGHRRAALPATALEIAALKTAKYTVERPLLIGGALAGAPQELRDVFVAYGGPLGLAFQLRDDLLGAFGDPAVTGKPVGVDFQEGKQTYLMAVALERASAAEAARLDALLAAEAIGADEISRIREILDATGAVEACESMIRTLADSAGAALDACAVPLPADASGALHDLVGRLAYRDS